MPENTLQAFAEHRRLKDVLPTDGGDAEDILAEFTQAGVNDAVLAAHLQREGTESFTKSWNDLLDCLASKSVTLKRLDRTGGKR
jgi:transaldolase